MYKFPDLAFNAAVLSMESRTSRGYYDVIDDPALAIVDDAEAYFAKIDNERRFRIYAGGSDRTIFGDPQVNHAFRAWHEWSHWITGNPFTLDGELAVAHRQCEDLALVYGHGATTAKWQRIIMAEVYGQALYYHRRGRFPDDQIAFDLAWLRGDYAGSGVVGYPQRSLANHPDQLRLAAAAE